ncbi:MAG: ATP-dependent zinc metalloprotease FtsH [Lachnospiraceae bacterium]|nr:ATP-dependent zinc metalloprotease FtsH [Lachnospiraceae bacterium]
MENKGNNNNNGGNNNGGNNKNGMTIMIFILTALLVLFLTSLLNSCAKDATNKEITYSEFIDMVEKDKVESVTFTSSRINITPKGENKLYRITYYTAELNDESLIPLLKEHDVKFGGTVEDVSTMIMWNMLSYILPLVLVWVLLYFLIFRKMGSGGMMGVGKTTAKVYVEKSTGVTFRDVAGQDEAKESLQEVVDFLHNPRKYTDIGAKLPKGALLVGPPGTGKTLLAKAVAGEAKVPFFSLAGSDFVEMFVGVGASRVRDLFKEAQKQAPCIIFIDEIDAIGKSRDTRYGGNDEREQTLNQLLAEMDGFDTSKGLLILAATNRPEVLDKALLRPGRFDRRIIVDKPDLKGRVETLKVHAKNVLLDDSVDLDAIALATSGAVGSDLANMINEAAINAVKQGRKYVNQSDLFESVEVVVAGKEKKDRIMGPKEKKMVAYHEVGHALVTALQKDAEPVQKITIVPRTMGALGYTMQVPEEEKFLMTKNELVAHLVTYMGGRAAEEIVFDSVTTGASNDIEQATKIARAMVTQYGMSEKFGLMGLVTIESQYLDGRASLNCGEETAGQIDQEVMRILKESYDEATRLLLENREILDKISQQLYENETITGKEFMKIFRELKGIPEPEEKTEAEKAAESFQAEQEHVKQQAPTVQMQENVKQQAPTVEMQEHMKQQAPTVEIQEEEILVNTLREEDLPPELSGKEEASPEHQELEVNTLEGEKARPRQEQKVELIPVTVNMPNLQKPEAPGQMEASETMKKEAKPAVPEAKEEARPVSLEASTPEELGFFPAKKGSGKKGKSIPAKKEASVPKQQPAEEALREKQSGKGQTSSSKPEPEKTEQEAEEDYLDQLLKELK